MTDYTFSLTVHAKAHRWDTALERDLGTERGPVLAGKLERYRRIYFGLPARAPLHVGFVVDSARRAASVRARLRGGWAEGSVAAAWVVAEPALTTDPYGALWSTPDGAEARAVDFAPAAAQPVIWIPIARADDAVSVVNTGP